MWAGLNHDHPCSVIYLSVYRMNIDTFCNEIWLMKQRIVVIQNIWLCMKTVC